MDGFKPGKGFYNIISENTKSMRAAKSNVNFQKFEEKLFDQITNANAQSKEEIFKNLWLSDEKRQFNYDDQERVSSVNLPDFKKTMEDNEVLMLNNDKYSRVKNKFVGQGFVKSCKYGENWKSLTRERDFAA